MDEDEFKVWAGIKAGDLGPFAKLLRTEGADFGFLSKNEFGLTEILADILDGKSNDLGFIYKRHYLGNRKKAKSYKNEQAQKWFKVGKVLDEAGVSEVRHLSRFFYDIKEKWKDQDSDFDVSQRTYEDYLKKYRTYKIRLDAEAQKLKEHSQQEIIQQRELKKELRALGSGFDITALGKVTISDKDWEIRFQKIEAKLLARS